MGFEIDERAFRAQNLHRPPGHLVRELVQNAFDEEGAKRVILEVRSEPGYTRISIEDEVPRGFQDPKEIWTIFASGKKDSPLKRGRMGRGLKEMIAVSDDVIVETVGKTVHFKWKRKEFERTVRANSRERGTLIVCEIPSWTAQDAQDIRWYLKLFIPPPGLDFQMVGLTLPTYTRADSFEASLPTVFVENEVMVQRVRKTEIRLYSLQNGETPWIYEMGIPIEPIKDDGFPFHIDVQQRVPLKPERDVVPRSYLRQVFGCLANHRMEKMSREDASKLWVEEAVSSAVFDKEKAGALYVKKRFGENVVRLNPMDPDNNVRAVQDGLPLVDLRGQTDAVRDLVRTHAPSTSQVFAPSFGEAETIPEDDWTDDEKDFVAFAQWLGGKLSIGAFEVEIYTMDRDRYCATWNDVLRQVNVNRKRVGKRFFARGNTATWVNLLVHEFAHRKGNGHDQSWYQEFGRLSGLAFMAAVENVEFLREKGWA